MSDHPPEDLRQALAEEGPLVVGVQIAGGCGCLTALVAFVGAYLLWSGTTSYVLIGVAVASLAFAGGTVWLVDYLKKLWELKKGAEAAKAFVEEHGPSVVEAVAKGVKKLSKGRTIKTKVAGVTFANPDGTDRQEIIRRYCRPGGELMLRQEPGNEHDEQAVSVWVRLPAATGVKAKWRQLGYINADLVDEVHALYEDGDPVSARILHVTEGGASRTLGVSIEIYKGS